MLNKLNLPPLTVFLFAPGEKHFGRGMQDDLRLDSQPAFNSDFNWWFPPESARKTRNEESSGDIFTTVINFLFFSCI